VGFNTISTTVDNEKLLNEFLNRQIQIMRVQEAMAKQRAEQQQSLVGQNVPNLAVTPKSHPTLDQRLYETTVNPMLSEQDKNALITKMLQEKHTIDPGISGVGGAATLVGGALAAPKLIDYFTRGILKHEPYLTGGKGVIPSSPASGKDVSPQDKKESVGSKLIKDVIKVLGTYMVAASAANYLARKSGFKDLRTPMSQANVSAWSLEK